jgi:hypothetical protein
MSLTRALLLRYADFVLERELHGGVGAGKPLLIIADAGQRRLKLSCNLPAFRGKHLEEIRGDWMRE